MATKIMREPWLWKRFTSNAIESYVGVPGEPIIDLRTGTAQLKICDGIKVGGHTVNGEKQATGVAAPTIVAPMDGAMYVDESPGLVASAFSGLTDTGASDTHVATYWEVSALSDFTTTVYASGRDTVNLTTIELSTLSVVLPEGSYYVRVKYEGGSGTVSNWSPTSTFTVDTIVVGDVVDGDIVVGQLNGDWLLVAPATLRVLKTWNDGSVTYIDSDLPNNPDPDPNSGTFNTSTLVSLGQTHAAADYARNFGYDLPNIDEVSLIFTTATAIDSADDSGGAATLAAIISGTADDTANSTVSSSTEVAIDAHAVYLAAEGVKGTYSKNLESWVLPVRRIPV